jgi:subtilisin family serine protease
MAYVAYYDPNHASNGWTFLEGPATATSSTTLTWTAPAGSSFLFTAGTTYTFVAFTSTSALPTPSPTPVPTQTPTPTPTATPTPAGSSSTVSFSASANGPVTVTFGTLTGGTTATAQVPTASGNGTGSATLSLAPPNGIPAEANALAYMTIGLNQSLSFTQSPAISLTTPTKSAPYVYVATYSSQLGWVLVAGPGTLVGGKYVVNPTDENYQVIPGSSATFAIFGSSTLQDVNPPSSPIGDSCSALSSKRSTPGYRLAPRATSSIIPNRLYVSYRGSSAESLARSVGAIRTVDLTATKGLSHTIVTLAPGTNRDHAAATLRAQSGVASVSVLHTRSLLADGEANDPLLDNVDQWYLYRTNVDPGAWNITHGTPGVTIAVIDTGLDLTNADFTSSKLAFSESIVGGMVTASAQDTQGHGSNTAGLAAAATNNDYGYAGVGWNVGLLDYKIFPDSDAYSDCQGADTGDEAQAVDDAVNRNVSVISLSLGSPNSSGADPAEEDAIENAIAHNVTVVAANGNEFDNSGDGTLPDYPAAYPGVIAVGASAVFDSTPDEYSTITSETVASYSNSQPTLLAPGGDASSDNDQDILHWIEGYSTTTAGLPADRCSDSQGVCAVLFNGTSQATPQVAGTVGLMESYHGGARSLTPAQVKSILTANTDVLPSLSSTRQGAGRLDAAKAVAASHP